MVHPLYVPGSYYITPVGVCAPPHTTCHYYYTTCILHIKHYMHETVSGGLVVGTDNQRGHTCIASTTNDVVAVARESRKKVPTNPSDMEEERIYYCSLVIVSRISTTAHTYIGKQAVGCYPPLWCTKKLTLTTINDHHDPQPQNQSTHTPHELLSL